jgi:hypothetical protein
MAVVYNVAEVMGLKVWKFVCTALTVLFIADTEAETGLRSRPSSRCFLWPRSVPYYRCSCGRRCSLSSCWECCSPCLRVTTIAGTLPYSWRCH